MRDIKRIDVVLELIRNKWLEHPDQRFFQLLQNYLLPKPDMDLFYFEDDDYIKFLEVNNG